MSGFLTGRGFAGVSDAFGWRQVRVWIVWRARLARDVEQARFATRQIAPIASHAPLDALKAQEYEAADEAIERGALAAVAGFEPTTWTQVRFRLWRASPERRDGVALYDVGHVSLGRPRVAGQKALWSGARARTRAVDKERTLAEVAFLGLGVMGYPMAGHLKGRGGHNVVVCNRTAARAEKWVAQHGGAAAPSPREAAHGSAIVFACVGNDDDLRAVTLGPDGAFAGMARGAIFVDHTTASANVARELAREAEKHGLGFVDAPVSGGQAGAENGALTVMCGGDEATFAKVEPVIAAYARACNLMGPVGSGQLAKMVNQICIAGLVQGLAEGLHFAQRAGLDAERVVEVIAKGAAQSWQMDNRHKTMIAGEFDFGFAVDWMRKDLAICLDEARRNGAHLPVAALVDQFYSEVQAMGGRRWDTSSLIARLEK